MGSGTNKGGGASTPGVGLKIAGGDAKGSRKDVEVTAGHNRRFRNPKHGPKGTNAKGVAAGNEARKRFLD